MCACKGIQGGRRKENGCGGMQLKMVITCMKAKASAVGSLTSSLVLWSGRWWYPAGVC